MSESDPKRPPSREESQPSSGDQRWPEAERRGQADRRMPSERRRPNPLAETVAGRYSPANRRRTDRRTNHERRDESTWAAVPVDGPPDESREEAGLILAATAARNYAQAHYSGFKVGAALETADGEVVTGCNIENATYGLTLCAERVALVKALSEGRHIFKRIAVVADTPDPTPPCGPCRQLLWEYCGDIDVIIGNLSGPTARLRLSALLPMPFDSRLLK